MNLLKQCQQITISDSNSPENSLENGRLYMADGFLDTVGDTKTYSFPLDDRKAYIFLWDMLEPSLLRTAMCPYKEHLAFAVPFTHGQKAPLHAQDFIELAYVVKGELRQNILGKDITFQEGELCLIDKSCVHQDYLLDNSSLILFLCIRNDGLSEIMSANITTKKIIAFLQQALIEQKELSQYIHFRPTGNAREEMENCFSTLIQELREEKVGNHFVIKGILMRIFRLLSTEYEFQLSKQQRKDLNWAVFEEICHYIETNYKTITIQELTKVFHFQEDYFNRLIKKKVGKTYCEFLQDIRLFKAEQFLSQSDMTISQIAEEVGYRNKGYFYKLFVEKYGMTPAEYRKQL